ncbi:2S globulin, Glycoside hydrolase, chitinase active site protein [Heracleum sosnowskyi]|uniref:2S globulin, Glycoside hydrolase, chitinase active site protein n=1 Tax=Heracleum sosnowskyi TaxID=360622 RepID=A0AAD8N6G2_9APIA|nr:2S globulin, Glycoside hydrolase, chitinase active site protein [Heracleum sosnowskyi]
MKAWNILLFIIYFLYFPSSNAANSKLFREYIGAESDSVKLSDLPINSEVEFHLILAFAIDYTTDNLSPTDGVFNVFWETKNLGPDDIASIKDKHSNVKVAISLGGDTVGDGNDYAYFKPKSINSWVQNAVSSLTTIIKQYNIDGIDIDYEHYDSHSNLNMYVECIGQLITTLKDNEVISFASIAPFDDGGEVQSHYLALWRKYGHVIDYVNFQFYAYDKLSVPQFLRYYNQQLHNYQGGQLLASFIIKGNIGLKPDDGFFEACKELKGQGKLGGIYVWCADESKANGFKYEKTSQALLASS